MQERFYTGDTLPPMISIAHRAQNVKGRIEKKMSARSARLTAITVRVYAACLTPPPRRILSNILKYYQG